MGLLPLHTAATELIRPPTGFSSSCGPPSIRVCFVQRAILCCAALGNFRFTLPMRFRYEPAAHQAHAHTCARVRTSLAGGSFKQKAPPKRATRTVHAPRSRRKKPSRSKSLSSARRPHVLLCRSSRRYLLHLSARYPRRPMRTPSAVCRAGAANPVCSAEQRSILEDV